MLLALALKNLGRDRVRTFLAVFAIMIATLAFLLLQTTEKAWTTHAKAKVAIVVSQARVSFMMKLPVRSLPEYRAVPGVAAATPLMFVGGRIVGRESDDFPGVATDPQSWMEVYAGRIELSNTDRETWLRERSGVVLGSRLAARLGLKRGDKFSMTSGFVSITEPIPFVVAGIYSSSASDDAACLRFDYINESLPTAQRDQVTLVFSRVASGTPVNQIAKRIDDHFDTADTPTRSEDEAAFADNSGSSMRTLFVGIKIINNVLLVLIGLIVGNAIAMSVRERTSEYGTLRAIGFSSGKIGTMITSESCLICFLGALSGCILAFVLVNLLLGPAIESGSRGMFPAFRVSLASFTTALGASVVLGAVAALVPALRALRLRTVDALRSIG